MSTEIITAGGNIWLTSHISDAFHMELLNGTSYFSDEEAIIVNIPSSVHRKDWRKYIKAHLLIQPQLEK